MKAKVIFISEKEMLSTNNTYALAGSVSNEERDSVYVRLSDVIDFVQTSQNASAEEMIKMQETAAAEGQRVDTRFLQSEWRTYNYILSELKRYQTTQL